MANWHGTARSNYFKVKDLDAFFTFADSVNLGYHTGPGDTVMIHTGDSEDGAWPSSYYDDELEDYIDFDLLSELSLHLQDGQVAVLMEVGAEKLRYVSGYAVAVNSEGSVVQVSLDDIYEKAAKTFGIEPTKAEY